jgi:hypothetical protein
MKITLEFNLPEDREEYEQCYKGSDYINAIREIVEYLRNKIKYSDHDGDNFDGIYSVQGAFEKIYERVFYICKDNGFSPWED